MWPRLIAQLIELLPHIARLVPMADMFFASKAATDRTSEAALVAMAEDVRGDLGKVTAAHASLYRQLQDQSAQIAEVGQDARAARLAAEKQVHRIDTIEHQVASLGLWIKAGVSLLVILAAIILVLLLELVHRH